MLPVSYAGCMGSFGPALEALQALSAAAQERSAWLLANQRESTPGVKRRIEYED